MICINIQLLTRLFLTSLTFALSLNVRGQSDSTTSALFSNSCDCGLNSRKMSIHYSYNVSTQTHDYSNNWDFDGDSKTDRLYFIGTGGAHLYFYLRIVLSFDNKVRNFLFLDLDMPCPGDISELKKSGFYPPPLFPQFVVDKFYTDALGDNANDKIYLHLDQYSEIPNEWKKKGVTSRYLLLKYKDGKIVISNFIE